MEFMPNEGPNHTWSCDIADSLDFPQMQSDAYQWFGVSQCYAQILAAEENRGRPYEWIYRTRTDLVLLQPLPLNILNPSFAHVPIGGFSHFPVDMCVNDHLLLCPRGLCRAYFELLELWQSPLCTRNETEASGDIFATELPNGTLIMNEAPSQRFLLPSWTNSTLDPGARRNRNVQVHFLARYQSPHHAHGDACHADRDDPSCCGLMREFPLYYSIARGDGESGIIECLYTLQGGWRQDELDMRHNNSDAIAACEAINDEYARGASEQKMLDLCNPLPGSTVDMPDVDRRQWCLDAFHRVHGNVSQPSMNSTNSNITNSTLQ